MKKITVVLTTFLLIMTGVTVYLLFNLLMVKQKIVTLESENASQTKALKQNKSYIQSLQKNEQKELKASVDNLRVQQSSASAVTINTKTGIYIDTTSTVLSSSKQTVTFLVKGPEKSVFDAMDLSLAYSNVKNKPECTTGAVFDQYPLKDISDSTLTITGVAQIVGSSITTGVLNKSFVVCTFEKKDLTQKVNINLDLAKTHIYSLGESVFNLEASTTHISW